MVKSILKRKELNKLIKKKNYLQKNEWAIPTHFYKEKKEGMVKSVSKIKFILIKKKKTK